ncbi:MAG: DUF2695 domain-containing protein [Cyclobacteriaceae bacterium]
MNENLPPKYNLDSLTKKQKELIQSLPFAELIFRKLFFYLDEQMGERRCQHDFSLTHHFLAQQGIDFDNHKEFFTKHGGVCDCEILYKMDDLFPIDENEFKRNVKD